MNVYHVPGVQLLWSLPGEINLDRRSILSLRLEQRFFFFFFRTKILNLNSLKLYATFGGQMPFKNIQNKVQISKRVFEHSLSKVKESRNDKSLI